MANTTMVQSDRPCIHCGYNLRGLPTRGRCPECHTPIWDSLRGSLLKYADPEWINTLRFGTTLKLCHLGVGLVLGFGAAILIGAGLLAPWMLTIPAIVGGSFGVWASFVITTQEPRISLQEDPVTWRKLIRVCAVAAFLGSLLEQVGRGGHLATTWLFTGRALSLVGIVTMFGELMYFSRFAERIPDARLARATRVVMWGSTITLSIMIGLGIVMAWLAPAMTGPSGPAPGGSAPAGVAVLGVALCIGLVPAAIFFLWYVGLLMQYRRAFSAAARQADHPATAESVSRTKDHPAEDPVDEGCHRSREDRLPE